jgi:DNA-binding response OmpR family regulator
MSSRQPRILLVDDERDVLEILCDYLTDQGFAVRTAMNGLEALLEAKQWTPKAVILDLFMPRLGGLGTLERIRQINPGVVVILISGRPSALVALTEAGVRVAGALAKPLNLPEMLATLVQAGVAPMKIPQGATPADRIREDPPAIRKSVLVVDDEPDVRAVLVEYLQAKGFDPLQASSGDEALERVRHWCPDIVLLDIALPGLSGIETLRRLKAACPRTCVVMVSANEDTDIAQQALAMGAADYVPKPVDFGYLDSVLAIHTLMDHVEIEQRPS